MRDAIVRPRRRSAKVNPLQPVELVIDHSVQVDHYGNATRPTSTPSSSSRATASATRSCAGARTAFENFRVVPPDTGIVHQVNLEYLARSSSRRRDDGACSPIPTRSSAPTRTPRWSTASASSAGASAASRPRPRCSGSRSRCSSRRSSASASSIACRKGATATDLVLTITERLRKLGVVGKFVEFFGPASSSLTIADRATLGNMSPEYGATIAICPIDDMTLDYLRLTGRDDAHVKLVEAYAKEQGLFRTRATRRIRLHDDRRARSLDGRAEPRRAEAARRIASRSGRPSSSSEQALEVDADRAQGKAGGAAGQSRRPSHAEHRRRRRGGGNAAEPGLRARPRVGRRRRDHELHQHVEPERDDRRGPARAERRRARAQDQAVGEDQPRAGLAGRHRVLLKARACLDYLDELGFNIVGYGCTTCIGNSGRCRSRSRRSSRTENLVVASVLSGNRNFEGRIQSQVRANYLASPPLVVAYALAGTMQIDLTSRAARHDRNGKPVYLATSGRPSARSRRRC